MVEILYRFLWQCVWFYNSICSGIRLIIYGPILYCIVTVCRTYCNILFMQYMKHITGQSINTVYIV